MTQELKEPQGQTFVEVALTLGGKSEEEARKTGKLDRADEQVEALFAPRYQTANSPVHRAVWDELPVDLFLPMPPTVPASCQRVMSESIAIVARHRSAGTLFDANRKIADAVL